MAFQQEQNVPRFDWSEIIKSVAIAGGVSLLYAIAVPVVGTLLGSGGNTGPVAGNDLFLWSNRAVLLAVVILRGIAMGKVVGDRIVDDMLVTAGLVSGVWLVIKIIVIVIVFGALNADGTPAPPIHVNDLLAMGAAVGASWLGARANRF